MYFHTLACKRGVDESMFQNVQILMMHMIPAQYFLLHVFMQVKIDMQKKMTFITIIINIMMQSALIRYNYLLK